MKLYINEQNSYHESANNFDIENMIFEINVWLPTLYSTETDKELSFSESWKLDRNLLIPDRKLDADGYDNMLRNVQTFVENNIPPTIRIVADDYNSKHNSTFMYVGEHKSKRNMISNKIQSFAYYVTMGCDVSDINCSDTIRNNISRFEIRIANHVSKDEFRTFETKNNARLYHNQMLDLCEEQFKAYVWNIFDRYYKFLIKLSDYEYIDCFADIADSDVDIVKSIAFQGRFEEYEKRYKNNL